MRNHWHSRLWKRALVLALIFHMAVLGIFVFGPTFFNTYRKRPVPYTVNLFEPAALKKDMEAPSATTKERPVLKKMSSAVPKRKKKLVKVAKKAIKPKPKPKPVAEKRHVTKKAVSLNPKKVKKTAKKQKKKDKRKRVASPSKEQINKNGQDVKIAQKIKAIQKRLEQKRQEEYLKRRLEELAKKQKKQNASGQGQGMSGSQSRQAMIYGNFIKAKIWRNWRFPKALADRKDLEAVVTIIITKDGRILDMRVKRYSGYSVFDRSVLKAIKDSAPLPPLPPALGQGPEEIDIRFDLSKAGLTG